MPIYEYRCQLCQEVSDHFLKVSAPAPTHCPKCNTDSVMVKKATAASFRLKGTGWYETDFKDKSTAKQAKESKKPDVSSSKSGSETSSSGPASSSSNDSKPSNSKSSSSSTPSSSS